MEVERTTVPGHGTLHHCHTRGGVRFALLSDAAGNKRLLVFGAGGTDEPAHCIGLEADEADQVADLLLSSPLPDRIARVERRLDRLIRHREQS
ncbi:hypothetical protein NONO_c49160 [Nocardia nova SH22a]|uniref:Potassium/proton antiporter subunit KhtT-like N-terminal domain-containing protein n=1 Tax=Nocardia nova SH22a TaxID=1415166 RepID=W5TK11_9NOCA|nr:hypothetical protein [Nocardia nova]AHH19700.1 hypothetical protein NONO_c49160 [Nocardia nova SH22a]